METVIELILAMLPNAGDKKSYPDVHAAVPAELRAHLPKARKVLKADGRIKEEVVYEAGVNTHSLIRL